MEAEATHKDICQKYPFCRPRFCLKGAAEERTRRIIFSMIYFCNNVLCFCIWIWRLDWLGWAGKVDQNQSDVRADNGSGLCGMRRLCEWEIRARSDCPSIKRHLLFSCHNVKWYSSTFPRLPGIFIKHSCNLQPSSLSPGWNGMERNGITSHCK